MAKNTTHKKDKATYRPWRSKTVEFLNCYSCGTKLYEKDMMGQKFCPSCKQKLTEGYDLW